MHLWVLHLLVLVFNAWSGSEPRQLSQGANGRPQISGRIVDRLGCPMIATLTLRQPYERVLQEARSDVDGRFTFRDVATGHYWIDYDLQAGAGGDVVDVTDAGAYKELRFSSPDRRSLDMSVVVTDSEGAAVAGADVAWRRFSGAVDGPSCETATGITDVQGRATARGLPSGTYRVVAKAPGFVQRTRDVSIGFGQRRTRTAPTVRLLTPVESERRARSLPVACEFSSEPETLPALVSGSDAIVVGRIRAAVLDPDYGAPGLHPSVLTRYDVEVTDVIKAHPHLAAAAQHVALVQSAGELDWGNDVVLGCSQKAMRSGETYVLFLTWNEHLQTFTPWHGSGLLVDITSDVVAPFRAIDTPAAILDLHAGEPASEFIRDIRAVVRDSR